MNDEDFQFECCYCRGMGCEQCNFTGKDIPLLDDHDNSDDDNSDDDDD